MDRTIKSVEEVEVILGAPVLGTIPHFSLVERIERVKAENRRKAHRKKVYWIATIHPCLEDKYGFIWTTKEEL